MPEGGGLGFNSNEDENCDATVSTRAVVMAGDHTAEDAQVEDYLDHIVAPLVGAVPYETRLEIRRDILAHLRQYIAAHEELGSDPAEATAAALRQFGPPSVIASRWMDELHLSQRKSLMVETKRSRIPASFKPTVLWLGAEILTWVAGGVFLDRYMSGASASGYIAVGAMLPAITEFVAGRRYSLQRPVLGMLLAQAATVPFWTYLLMFLMREAHRSQPDHRTAILVGAVTFAALAPTGCIAAHLGAWSRTRGRRGTRRAAAS